MKIDSSCTRPTTYNPDQGEHAPYTALDEVRDPAGIMERLSPLGRMYFSLVRSETDAARRELIRILREQHKQEDGQICSTMALFRTAATSLTNIARVKQLLFEDPENHLYRQREFSFMD